MDSGRGDPPEAVTFERCWETGEMFEAFDSDDVMAPRTDPELEAAREAARRPDYQDRTRAGAAKRGGWNDDGES